MGYGDNIMATGMAKGAAKRGKRIAFGDGEKILWDHYSEAIFQDNSNIAPPGSEGDKDLEWIPYYRGNRLYNTHVGNKWVWNYDFKPIPGEIKFSPTELNFASNFSEGFVLVEPHVPNWKACAPNKRWPLERYAHIAKLLKKHDFRVKQFITSQGPQLSGLEIIKAPTFRHALAVLARARLYIGPEGGLHHGAAAVGVPGVVIFGSFIPPSVTGYDIHTNIAASEACGSLTPCEHCAAAMQSITIRQVYEAVMEQLDG